MRIVPSRLARLAQATTLIALVATVACGKKDADEGAAGTAAGTPAATAAGNVEVTDIKLGSAVNGQALTNEKDDFKPGEMIYAAVMTKGASSDASLTARWTFEGGQTVDSTMVRIAPTGDASTLFHIMKPDGFPKGKYKVTVYLNGAEAKSKDFEVDD
jgi:hypothetical protein